VKWIVELEGGECFPANAAMACRSAASRQSPGGIPEALRRVAAALDLATPGPEGQEGEPQNQAPRPPSAVQEVIDRYLIAEGKPPDMALDVAYQLQMHVIRSMLSMLDDALKAEGVAGETRLRAVRRLLYGSPWPDAEDARGRMREQEEALKVMMLEPPMIRTSLGLPPK